MDSEQEQVGHDLRRYLCKRIENVSAEIFDTSVRFGFSKDDAVAIIFVAIAHELVITAHATGLEENEFVEFARQHFRRFDEKKKAHRQ